MTGRLLVTLGVLVVAACGPGPVVRRGALDANVLTGVERGLERVRGLHFTTTVPGRVLDDAALGAMTTIQERRDDGEPQLSEPFGCQVATPECCALVAPKARALASERVSRSRATYMHSL